MQLTLKCFLHHIGIIEKNSYVRHDYESVDAKSLSRAMFRKTTKKTIHAIKG